MVATRTLITHVLVLSALAFAACTQGSTSSKTQTSVDPHEKIEFFGSQTCVGCHDDAHASWEKTWMARTVRPPVKEELQLIENSILCGGIPVDYVLGGRINLRYLQKRDGDIVFLPCEYDTNAKEIKAFRVNDWPNFSFVDRCAACHTTNFNTADKTWTELGVGCESCHGPASRHGDFTSADRMVQYGEISAVEEGMICSSCHLQGGFSKKSERRFPENYIAGMDLFAIYSFPWESLDAATDATAAGQPAPNPIDVHQKILMKRNLDGESELRCTSCHEVHQESDEKHQSLPKEDFCYQCHTNENGEFGLKDYVVECPVCEF